MNRNLLLRTVFIDAAMDAAFGADAALSGASKAEVFRSCLAAGMAAVKAGLAKPKLASTGEPFILKTVYIDGKADEQLRLEAFDRRMPKNDVLREYLAAGMVSHAREVLDEWMRLGHPGPCLAAEIVRVRKRYRHWRKTDSARVQSSVDAK